MWRIHWKNFLSDLDHFFMCFAGAACELQRQLVRTPKLLNIDLVPCELLVRSNRFRQRPFVTRPLRRTWSMCFVFRYMFQLKHSMQIFVWRFACFLCSSSKLEFGNPDVISCIRPKTNIAAADPGQLLMLWMERRNHPKNGWKKYDKITLNLQQITSWMMNMMVKHLVFWRTLLSDKPNDGKKNARSLQSDCGSLTLALADHLQFRNIGVVDATILHCGALSYVCWFMLPYVIIL